MPHRLSIIDIARICHEAHRGYCEAIGDFSHQGWNEATIEHRRSIISGVLYYLNMPESTAADTHQHWLLKKQQDGWKYGPIKNEQLKEHPCCLPFDQLPIEHKAKSFLFVSIVSALRDAVGINPKV